MNRRIGIDEIIIVALIGLFAVGVTIYIYATMLDWLSGWSGPG